MEKDKKIVEVQSHNRKQLQNFEMFLHEKDEEIRRLEEKQAKLVSTQAIFKQEIKFLNDKLEEYKSKNENLVDRIRELQTTEKEKFEKKHKEDQKQIEDLEIEKQLMVEQLQKKH